MSVEHAEAIETLRRLAASIPQGPEALMASHDLVERSGLPAMDPFARARGKLIAMSGGGASTYMGAFYALRRCLEGASPEDAVADAAKAINENKSTFQDVFLVRGLHLRQRVSLAEDLALVPITAGLEGHPLFRHLVHPPFDFTYLPMAGFPAIFPVPSCAIVADFAISPAILDSTQEEPREQRIATEHRHGRVRRFALSLALAASKEVITVPAFTSHCVTPGFNNGAWVTTPFLPDGHMRNGAEIDIEAAKALFESFEAFNQPEAMELAAEHYLSAMLAGDDRASAIELGTALEIALLHGTKSHDELSHRVSTRAGWLMGSSPGDRKAWHADIRAIYNYRSAAVHQGKRPEDFNRVRDGNLCRQVLKRIVERGAFPDWDVLIFGGLNG